MYEQQQQRTWRRKWPESHQESEPWKTWDENGWSWDAWSEWKGRFYLLIVLIVFRLVEAQWISSGGVGVPNSRQSPGLENPTSRYIKQHYLDSKCADLLRTPWKCSDFGRRKSTEEVQQEVLAMDLRQACPHLFSTCFRRCGTPRPT